MKQKCIIFGAGYRGTAAYQKLSVFFQIIAYTDNNAALWGMERHGLPIISPSALPEVINDEEIPVFIANERHYNDIADQLDGIRLRYYLLNLGLCYQRKGGVWYPVSLKRPEPYRKTEAETFAVLFVQDKPCSRTNKIAAALKKRGAVTYCAYSHAPSDMGGQAYDGEVPFWTYEELLDFVNQSDFDIIHCSNEPDIFVNILLQSNKKIIHDCHDALTVKLTSVSSETAALEYMANTQADGIMFTTEGIRNILCCKYGIPQEKAFILGNYPISSFKNVGCLPKLRDADGEIHCVYEGTIVDRAGSVVVPYRFYEPMFIKLADAGVHVHIYSSMAPEYLKRLDSEHTNIHYEGNYSGEELILRMTQYDLGFWFSPAVCTQDEVASPNKLFEYLSAGIPVVTNMKSWIGFLEENHCGGTMDLNGNILTQLRRYQKMSVPQDFCDLHGLTMDANAERILEFYSRILKRT